MFFKSPVIPALGFWVWESINHFLPSFLKSFSIIHYVRGLAPFQPNAQLFELSSEPPTAAVSMVVLTGLGIVGVTVAAVRARRMQISYGSD